MNHWDLYLRVRMACIQDALAEGKSVAEVAVLFGLDTAQARSLTSLANQMGTAPSPKREIRIVTQSGTVVMTFNTRDEYQAWYDRQISLGHTPLECWKHPQIVYTFVSKE